LSSYPGVSTALARNVEEAEDLGVDLRRKLVDVGLLTLLRADGAGDEPRVDAAIWCGCAVAISVISATEIVSDRPR
jgi:hypothetical protein